MLSGLLLEELADFAFGDNLHHVIISYGLVEPVFERFSYGRTP
jgi:hypothetical protein